jgi:hypothetical protein
MEEMRNAHKVLVGNMKRKHHLEDQGMDGKILKWISCFHGAT